jgi:hypothetical protein
MRVDSDFLVKQVELGRIKKPWRRMTKRQFKKHAPWNFDHDDLFILATNAKVGDIYHEHEANHRICKIQSTGDPAWIPIRLCTQEYDRYSRRGMIKTAGYLSNELGEGICGCGSLQLPVSFDAAGELALVDCLSMVDKDRTREMHKKFGWYKSERIFASRFDWTLEIRTSSVYLLYVDYMRKIVDLYDEIGAAAIVDSDGVLLKHIRDTKKELWVMCSQARIDEEK